MYMKICYTYEVIQNVIVSTVDGYFKRLKEIAMPSEDNIMKYIDITRSLHHLVSKYPEIKPYLIEQGLKQVEDDTLLETIGKRLTLQVVIQSKGLNEALFTAQLEEIIASYRNNADTTLSFKETNQEASIRIQGVLPCPVRLPLLEGFEEWLEKQPEPFKNSLNYELQAASMGVDWIKESLIRHGTETEIADVFISAGFDLFFDQRYMGHLKKEKVFEDCVPYVHYNKDFDNESISLIDPDHDYSVIAAVPAVFLVNKEALQGRVIPQTWEDLLNGNYDNSISIPVGDFDLFNAILLNIHARFGMDGVRKLGRTLMRSMHPAEMVKSNTKPDQPAVTIMPYFFTRMVPDFGPMVAVWPQDGAIISPIFLLSKKSKRAEIQPLVDFFSSKEVGEILSHNGRFPSTHPEVDNQIPATNTYMWMGWEYIREHNIGQLIEECIETFNGGKL